jgi:hypothetical protein
MNPLLKASIGGIVRAALVYLGAHGVDLGNHDADQIIDAALVIGPVIWSIAHKIEVHNLIADARAGFLGRSSR